MGVRVGLGRVLAPVGRRVGWAIRISWEEECRKKEKIEFVLLD